MRPARHELEPLEQRLLLTAEGALVAAVVPEAASAPALEASAESVQATPDAFGVGGIFEGMEPEPDVAAPEADDDDAAAAVETVALAEEAPDVLPAAPQDVEPPARAPIDPEPEPLSAALVTTLHGWYGPPERGLDAADTGGGEVGLLAVTTVAGNLSGNVVWSGTIHVTGDALVTLGASVTVQPGTVVKFAQGRRLQVSGTMQAVGTADQPIAFTSIH